MLHPNPVSLESSEVGRTWHPDQLLQPGQGFFFFFFLAMLTRGKACCFQTIRGTFCESSEGVRLPKERGRPLGRSGNFQGRPGNILGSPWNFRRSLGSSRRSSGLLLKSSVGEVPGKSPRSFRGSSAKFWVEGLYDCDRPFLWKEVGA